MTARIFPTAQDAESAFYDALARGNVELMMAVWADDEEIVCVHPGGPRFVGQEQVRDSWRKILEGGSGLGVNITSAVTISGAMVAVHSVHESLTVPGESKPRGPVVATNVYLRTAEGWRMVAHHASPAPGQVEAPVAAAGPKILH
jgi:ketosteroid isomerase-like protein